MRDRRKSFVHANKRIRDAASDSEDDDDDDNDDDDDDGSDPEIKTEEKSSTSRNHAKRRKVVTFEEISDSDFEDFEVTTKLAPPKKPETKPIRGRRQSIKQVRVKLYRLNYNISKILRKEILTN